MGPPSGPEAGRVALDWVQDDCGGDTRECCRTPRWGHCVVSVCPQAWGRGPAGERTCCLQSPVAWFESLPRRKGDEN